MRTVCPLPSKFSWLAPILFLTCSPLLAQLPSRARLAGHEVFFSPDRSVRIGLVDYGHHAQNPALMAFIAKGYDAIASGDSSLDFAFYHRLNPSLEILCYFNSILLSLDQPAPAAEEAYLHNGAVPVALHGPSNRIGKFFEGRFHFVMDPASPAWQAHSRAQIQTTLAAGFDGVLIDDVFAHLMHEAHFNAAEPLVIGTPTSFTTFSSIPAWYDPQTSHDAWAAYLSDLNQQFPKTVVYNGINDFAENGAPIAASLNPADYEPLCDGAIQEGFVYNGKGVPYPSAGLVGDAFWEATVSALVEQAPGMRDSIVSYGDVNDWRARAYSFASFLIGFRPGEPQTFYFAPDEFTLTSLPEWTLDLGSPLETHPLLRDYFDPIYGVYIRRFERALVLVNPYASDTSRVQLPRASYLVLGGDPIQVASGIALGGPRSLRFRPVRSVQVGAYSAVILMQP